MVAIVSGCAHVPQPPAAAPDSLPPGFPATHRAAGYPDSGRVYRVLPEESEIRILVYRDGRLAKFGHNHVLVSRDVRGYLYHADTSSASRADLFFPVASLLVDDPADRAAAGDDFASTPAADAVAGTRRNLLGEQVLDAARFPYVVAGATGDGARSATVELIVKNARITVPVELNVKTDGDRVQVEGRLAIAQTRLGIEPYSVLGGALRVRDEIEIGFRLTGERIDE